MAESFLDRIKRIFSTISFKFVLFYTLLNAAIICSVLGVETQLIKKQDNLMIDGEDFSLLANIFGGILNIIVVLIQLAFIVAFFIVITLLFNIFFAKYSNKQFYLFNAESYLKTIKITIISESLISLIVYIIAFGFISGLILFVVTVLYLPLYTYLYLYLKVYKKIR